MDDASLAAFMALSDEEAAIIIPGLSPEKRAVFERMAEVVADINLGVVPEGVIVCREHRHHG
jgi:hypothetical protein